MGLFSIRPLSERMERREVAELVVMDVMVMVIELLAERTNLGD